MSERIFVDTNVLVYVYDMGQPAKRTVATQWLQRLWRDRCGRTSIQVLNELYVTLTRKLPHRMTPDEAWDIVQTLTAWDPQVMDRELLLRGREIERRYRTSWWDGLIVAAAQLQDCDVLLSEDLQHGMRFDQVIVQNPFESFVQEPRMTYAVDQAASRHRRPGRPRKRAAAV